MRSDNATQAECSSPLDRLLARFPGAVKEGLGYRAACPSHDDQTARALFFAGSNDSAAIIECGEGCALDSILQAIGLTRADLLPAIRPQRPYPATPQPRRLKPGEEKKLAEAAHIKAVTDELLGLLMGPLAKRALDPEASQQYADLLDECWDVWAAQGTREAVQARFLELRADLVEHAPKLLRYLERRIQKNYGEADFAQKLAALTLAEARKAAKDDDGNPWGHIKDAPTFISEPQPEFEGLAKEVLAPGAITILSAPRGLGKTHIGHDLGVSLATGGTFRGEPVRPVRVLLLDRDNPEYLIRQRLNAWGAVAAEHLHILTRQHALSIRDRRAWAHFPVEEYQVLIVDAVGSFTEGITEKEGRAMTEVLATLVDLARKDLAILLLQNATKDGMSFKGREEWADRADIIYEPRDATDFTPSLKKPWWEELPQAHEGAWAARAARHKGRCDLRLAFTPSKYRLRPEPEPFCLELRLLPDAPWTVEDVTVQLEEAGARAKPQAEQAEGQQRAQATNALAALVATRASTEKPVLKTEAETFLCREQGLKRKDAREVIDTNKGELRMIVSLPHARGKPEVLFPVHGCPALPANDGGNTSDRKALPDKDAMAAISASPVPQGRQEYPTARPDETRAAGNGDFRRDGEVSEDPFSVYAHNGHHPTDTGTEEFDL